MNIHRLTIFLILLIGCQSKNTDESGQGKLKEEPLKQAIELDPNLVKDFSKIQDGEYTFVKAAELKGDLDENGNPDLITLNKLKDSEADPGDFHQITIELDNGIKWAGTNIDGWVRFDHNYTVPDPIKKLNQIDTDLLLLTKFGNTKIIGLFGWVYASEPGLLTIVEFSSGQPRVMINRQFDLVSLDSTRITTGFLDDKCWTEVRGAKLTMTCE